MDRRSFLRVAGAAAAATTMSPVRRASGQDAKTLVVAWDTDIDTLDPAHFKAIGGYVTVANCYDTVIGWKVRPIQGKVGFFRSQPGEWEPMIAESWAQEREGATLVFKIRRNAKFPSGRPVTAQGVKYCFDRGLQSPGYMRIVIPALIQVDSPDQFQVRDDYTFAINMKAPTPMAMDVVALSNNAIIDPEEAKARATSADPWAGEWLKRNIAGVGPYRLVKNEPGVEIVLESTKGAYWRSAPYFDRIVLKFVPNEADRVLLLKKKAIDMVVGRPGLSPKNVKSLEGEQGLKVFSVPDTTCHWLCMNTQKPPFDNVKVRQAINYAIPIQAILPNVLYGYATQMKSPVPHLTPGYSGTLSPYTYDIEKARQLIKEAGVTPGPVELAVRVGYTTHEQASVWIQRELEKLGFKVTIVKETDAAFRQAAIKGNHALSLESFQSWVNDPWYHLVFNFHTKSKFTNASFYSNPVLDKHIDESMHETDPRKRLGNVLIAQKILIDDAVWGFLWYDSWTRVMKSDLVGLEKRWDTFERYYAVRRA